MGQAINPTAERDQRACAAQPGLDERVLGPMTIG